MTRAAIAYLGALALTGCVGIGGSPAREHSPVPSIAIAPHPTGTPTLPASPILPSEQLGAAWPEHSFPALDSGVPNVYDLLLTDTLALAVGALSFSLCFDAAVWTSGDGAAWVLDQEVAALGGNRESPCHADGSQTINSVRQFGDGYIALGTQTGPGPTQMTIWFARTAQEWRYIDGPSVGLDGVATDLLVLEDGLLAVGISQDWQSARLWRSVDGRAWEGFALPGPEGWTTIAGNVSRLSDGLVIVGSAHRVHEDGVAARHPLVWFSSDGQDWQAGDVAGFGEPGMREMSAPVRIGDRWVAVGSAGDTQDWAAAVWLSDDGRSWSRVPHDEDVFGGPGASTTSMTSVVSVDDLLVAVGCNGVARTMEEPGWAMPRMWTSADGANWTLLSLDPAAFADTPVACFNRVFTQGDRLVVLGARDSGASGASEGPSVLWTVPLVDVVGIEW